MSRLVRRAMVAAATAFAAGCCLAPGAWAAGELGLTVSGMPERLIVGDVATITAKVTNNDPVKTATDLRVNFIPQVGFDDPPILHGPACALIFEPSLSCSGFGDLEPGESGQVQITSSLPGASVAIAVGANAYVLGGDEGDQLSAPDPYPIWRGNVEPKADTKLVLSTSAESVAYGAAVVVRGQVTNTKAAGTAYGTAVKFSIPAGVEVLSKPGDCTGTPLNLTCPVGDLGPLLTEQRELTLRSSTEGAFTVLGRVTWDREDTTPIDTQGQVTVTVLAPPDTTPVPTPAPTKPATPKPRTASPGTLAQGLPASGSCRRSRRLTLVLRSRGTWDPIAATIRVTGRKRALKLKGTRAQRPFTLTLPRSGKVTLRLEVTYDNGRRYKATRSFRRC